MERNKPQLVILITTKDRRRLLERTLDSIFAQSYTEYRIVIVNDGSMDETREYLDSLLNTRVTVLHHEQNRGRQAALNSGLKEIKKGEWAVQFDDDDIFLPDAFEKIARVVSETPDDTEVLRFNTIFRTETEEFIGGYQFKDEEGEHVMSYFDVVAGLTDRGDARYVLKWTICERYVFAEDVVNEHEYWMLLARDGIIIRSRPEIIAIMDATGSDHMHKKRSRKMVTGWARSYRRFFKDHRRFLESHPTVAWSRSIRAVKTAIRARNPGLCLYFIYQGIIAAIRILNPIRIIHEIRN